MVGFDVGEFHLRDHQAFIRSAVDVDLDDKFFPGNIVPRFRQARSRCGWPEDAKLRGVEMDFALFPRARRATLEGECADATSPPQADMRLAIASEVTLRNLLVRVAREVAWQLVDEEFSLDFEVRIFHVGGACQGGDSNP